MIIVKAFKRETPLRIIIAFFGIIYCCGLFAAPIGTLDYPNIYASKGEMYGWACDSQNPNRILEIRFSINGLYAGSTQADVQRETGVANACGGKTDRGFSWKIPDGYFNGVVKSVSASIYYQGMQVGTLSNVPQSLAFPLLTTHPRGYVDHMDKEYIFGWACDPNQSSINSGITVDFYSQDHGFLGSTIPNMRREAAVSNQCGGASMRGFQFSIPSSLRSNKNHTIVAIIRNAANTVRKQAGNGLRKLYFSAAAYTNIATMPTITSANIDTYLSTTYDVAPFVQGNFHLSSYCYGPNAASQPLSWNVSQYTGFSVPLPASAWQRGLTNIAGHMGLQGNAKTYAAYVSYQPQDLLPSCQGYAGANVTAGWESNKPNIWGTDIRKEIGFRYEAKIPTSSGINYGGPAFLFEDTTRPRSFYLTVQMFDSRGLESETFVFNDCPGCPTSVPLVATTIGRNNSFGRTNSGNFKSSTFSGFEVFEFRLNGYHIENVLMELGCSNSNVNLLSCSPGNYRLRLAALGLETFQQATIGAAVRNPSLFISN